MNNSNIATISSRIGGALVDWLIISILSIPISYILTLILHNNLEKFAAINGYEKGYQVLGIMGWMITDVIYSVILQSSIHQSTFGQRAFGIKLSKVNGDKVNGLVVAIRCVVSYFSSAFLKLGYLMALFNKEKQTLHDFVTNTIVVRTNNVSTVTSPNTTTPKNNNVILTIGSLAGLIILLWFWNTYLSSNTTKQLSHSNNTQVNKSEWVLFDTDKIGKQMLPIKSFYDIGTIKKLSNSNYIVTIANVFDNPINIRNEVTNELMTNVRYEKRTIEINCLTKQSKLIEAQLYGTSLSDATQIRLSNMPKVGNDNFEASYVAGKICPTLARLN